MMQSPQPHIVLRTTVILEKETRGGQGNHQILLERLSDLANDSLPALFNDSFSAVIPDNEIWRMDRLTLEVDINDLSELEETIKLRLPGLIKAAVRKTSSKSENTKLRLPAETLGNTDLILHYLKTGTLSWNSPHTTSIMDVHEAFDKSLVANPTFVRQLQHLFLSNEKALERFLLYFETPQQWQLYEAIRKTIPEKKGADYPDGLQRYGKMQKRSPATVKDYWRQLLKSVSHKEISGMPDNPEAFDIGEKSEEREEGQSETKDRAIYLNHAGLIFLHPFIARFLESLELVREKAILRPDKAACVLHSLVTGTPPESEWQLVLSKVLLGLSMDTPLKLEPVSKNQLESGTEMIQAAIGHWSALGNVSIKGFRESFLQRPGRLTPIKEGWLLELEKAPYDMLMGQLPWQMSYIQLPWMKTCIRMNI
ncbi:hypothetical protein SAMN05421636_102368 [Pricia antarctica]|uniref:Uncharacterized protein n=1 Tax=Pricia antarctica TaxID=641691 RepID=A0A1G6YTJ2_9FLAO|nr:contractile injection system tape measure protein [Pricia antarctica]SDD93602.1 hypothetical protein SAMN05421636_102368 [Pricia antarctica]